MKTPQLSYGQAIVIPEGTPDYLCGRILTIIEALGLKESQEKSLKDLLRNEIYKISHESEGALYIGSALNNEIHNIIAEIREKHAKKDEPFSLDDMEWTITYKPRPNVNMTSTGSK